MGRCRRTERDIASEYLCLMIVVIAEGALALASARSPRAPRASLARATQLVALADRRRALAQALAMLGPHAPQGRGG